MEKMTIEERLREELTAASEKVRRAHARTRAAYEVVRDQLAPNKHASAESMNDFLSAMAELRRAMRDKGRIARVLASAARRRARRARAKSPVSLPASEVVPRGSIERSTSIRILVVDDNVDCAESLVLLLEHMGYQASSVYDGEAGIREALRARPDVMLLDLAMPGEDGYAVIRRLSQENALAHMRVVALTGDSTDRRQMVDQGFFAHVLKPYGIDELKRVIESAVASFRRENQRATM
jgi:CheY-like chemotaxis protein